jgi:hypothetical protein
MSSTGSTPAAAPPPSAPTGASTAVPHAQIPPPDDWTDARKVDKHQNPWAVMIDYTKTVITLATAVLGFTVTFAGTLVGNSPSWVIVGLICLAWVALIGAIATALWAVGVITGYLRGVRAVPQPAPALCNICYFALGLALVLFAIAGALRLIQGSPAPPLRPESHSYFRKLGNVGPFLSGVASLCEPKSSSEDCENRLNAAFEPLQLSKLPRAPELLVLVGSADRERLTRAAERQFGSNAGLARGRSEWVQRELVRHFPKNLQSTEFISIYTGPDPFTNAAQSKSELDRRVEVWAAASAN